MKSKHQTLPTDGVSAARDPVTLFDTWAALRSHPKTQTFKSLALFQIFRDDQGSRFIKTGPTLAQALQTDSETVKGQTSTFAPAEKVTYEALGNPQTCS